LPTIAHISPYMDPSAGGPPVVVDQLVQHAPDLGWTPLVITTDAHTPDRGEFLSSRQGFNVLPSGARLFLSSQRKQLATMIKQADMLHCHTLWSPLVGLSARLARQHRIPYLVSPHGMLDPYSLSQKGLKKKAYLTVFERQMLRQANGLLFTTSEEKRLAEKALGSFQRSDVIGLGAEAPDAPRERLAESFLRKHPEYAEKHLIVFCGRIHHKKRPEALVAAMPEILKSVPSAMLLFVGSGDPEMMTKLEGLAQRHAVEHAVSFTGFLSGTDKWEALAASKIFALPSHQENFGIAAAEALRIGLPVLLTKRVNIWREIVENEAGLALDEDDIVNSLAVNIADLLANEARLTALSRKAQAFADANYTWARCSQLTHQLYDQLISATSGDKL